MTSAAASAASSFFVRGILPAASILAAVAACSSAGDSASSQDAPIVINPDGGDHPGSVLVTLPAGEDLSRLQSFKVMASASGGGGPTVTIGTPYELPVGRTCLQGMETIPNGQFIDDDCTVEISSGATTTYPLAVSQYTHTNNRTLGLDVGTSPYGIAGGDVGSIQATPLGSNITGFAGRAVQAYQDEPAVRAARFPGPYVFRFGLFDGVEGTLQGGRVTTMNLDDFSNRRSARVVAPARVFPDAVSDTKTYTMTGTLQNVTRTSRALQLADGDSVLMGEMASLGGSPANVGATYQLQVGSEQKLRMPIKVSTNAGDAPVVHELQRLDINDVAVRKNDGSIDMRPGRWTLELAVNVDGGQTFVPLYNGMGFDTKRGVDVVPGTYRITTTYSTVESGSKEDVIVVTVP